MKRAVALLLFLAGCSQPTPAHGPRDILDPVPWDSYAAYDELGAVRKVSGCALDCGAVVSFRIPIDHPLAADLAGRSFVYDDALAMLVHLAEGRPDRARAIGRTLVALRNSDGTIGFSFDFERTAFVDARYVRAGVVSWAAYALATYALSTGEDVFRTEARAFADALLAARVDAQGDPRHGLIAAGRGRYLDGRVFDGAFIADYAVTEHQIDAYFLFRTLHALDPQGPYGAAADALAQALIRAAWIDEESVFAAGVGRAGPTADRALDAAGAWGATLLLAVGEDERARRSLTATRTRFTVYVDGYAGFAPYVGVVSDYSGADLSGTFFSEGTAGMGVLFARFGMQAEARSIGRTLGRLRAKNEGAIPYAFPESRDFPELPSAAPTAWLRLLERELAGAPPMVLAVPPHPSPLLTALLGRTRP
ncbi:MAG: hypothetical protein HYV09_02340 [Deltaproteobacteria bacterium]|nr:hypothetical protein [Deltaproteobacteria bacterium]